MRISDWSSDVCSSDLATIAPHFFRREEESSDVPSIHTVAHAAADPARSPAAARAGRDGADDIDRVAATGCRADAEAAGATQRARRQIGRAPCRERVCQYG